MTRTRRKVHQSPAEPGADIVPRVVDQARDGAYNRRGLTEAFVSNQPYRNHDTEEGVGPFGYLALVLAWAVPGLGHLVLGERARGIVFGLTIHLLFAAGLLLGGIKAINPPDQLIWTYTQFLAGWPMLIANRAETTLDRKNIPDPAGMGGYVSQFDLELRAYQNQRKDLLQNPEARQALAAKAFTENPLLTYHPKVQDVGAVYCGIAGMLNLLVMFDVLLRITGAVREEPGRKKAEAPAAEAKA